MKISVTRKLDKNDNLVFKITVKKCDPIVFKEYNSLKEIQNFINKTDPKTPLYNEIITANHQIKEKVFFDILKQLKFSIKHQVESKFNPICEEIYNWIYDHQDDVLKLWMSEMNPERVRYYFDNDFQPKISKDFFCEDKIEE